MNKEQILKKCIEKAQDNYWLRVKGEVYPELLKLQTRDLAKHYAINHNYEMLIFDHSFAKAFWGEDMIMLPNPDWCDDLPVDGDDLGCDTAPKWEYEIMELAKSTDRLEYMKQFIEEG